jgi:hypothetical protein
MGLRIFTLSILVCSLFLGGCAIFDAEINNRGGYLDKVADDHWFKADSKRMRALRALTLQASLARIASVSPKNDKDRQLMALRIGRASERASLIIRCGLVGEFGDNPLGVEGAKADECFYFDSLMVDYTTALFDLAMVAFPIEDTQRLLTIVASSVTGPVGALDGLNAIINLAKDALKYGRLIGGIYRDTVELEVQVWLASPGQAASLKVPEPYRVKEENVAPLRVVYSRGNDDMASWYREIASLRANGLEPVPDVKFFDEMRVLIAYLCGLVTSEKTFLQSCQLNWVRPAVVANLKRASIREIGAEIFAAQRTGPTSRALPQIAQR